MTKRVLLLAVGVLISSGCATLQVKKARLSQAKSVAIVGYTGVVALDDGKDKGGLAATIGAIKGANDLFSGKLDARRVEQAEAGYAHLATRLHEALGWTVAERSALVASPAYRQLLDQYPNRGAGVLGLQRLPDVLRAEPAAALGPAQRHALMEELHVDALALVKVRYEVGDTSGFAVAGIGKVTRYPRAVVELTVYDATDDQPVWSDRFARGETTREGLATTMGADIVANETPVLEQAADSGFDALLTRFRAQP